MRHPNSTDSMQGCTRSRLLAEDGSALVELIAWMTLVAVPLLGLDVFAVRVEQAFAVVQNMSRELARESSIGLDASLAVADLATDYGFQSSDLGISNSCVVSDAAGNCRIVRVTVRLLSLPLVPPATTLMAVNQ